MLSIIFVGSLDLVIVVFSMIVGLVLCLFSSLILLQLLWSLCPHFGFSWFGIKGNFCQFYPLQLLSRFYWSLFLVLDHICFTGPYPGMEIFLWWLLGVCSWVLDQEWGLSPLYGSNIFFHGSLFYYGACCIVFGNGWCLALKGFLHGFRCHCGRAVEIIRHLFLDLPSGSADLVVVLFDDWSLIPSFFISTCFVYSSVVVQLFFKTQWVILPASCCHVWEAWNAFWFDFVAFKWMLSFFGWFLTLGS